MVDKKGQPAKNAAEAWFYQGLIYTAIDTCKNEAFKALVAEPFPKAVEGFDNAKKLAKDGLFDFYKTPDGFPQVTQTQIFPYYADYYLKKGVVAYQDNKDYKVALEYVERSLYFLPEDTSILMNAGVFFAPSAEEYDKAIVYLGRYQAKGGASADAYIQLFSIYRDKKKDMETALVVAKEAIAKYPNNKEFPDFELDIYIKMDRLPEARAIMEKKAKADPTDKESRYYCGVISLELKDPVKARAWFDEAVAIDPKYFEAHVAIAEIVYSDAKKTKTEMNNLGNSKDDFKKKVELDKIYQDKLRVALPYWEGCEKLSPDDAKVLDNLYIMYTDLEMTAQATRIEKRMKTLGLLD